LRRPTAGRSFCFPHLASITLLRDFHRCVEIQSENEECG
jgi:hypothetical protein